ncbi:MAG: efflux RND transporter periplasmic adaptor subunit, partial [Tannerellaceae bacterium]|nr:efflux RND transporter periplasmic adaptor subunit [Tannerellaceae bacterium]
MKNLNLIIAVPAFLTMTACTDNKMQERHEKVIPVKIITIAPSTTTGGQNYVGTVEESSAISLSFSGAGTVERVLVSEGQRVSKGQLLAVLNGSTAQNAYDVAKSTLRQAQDAYDRLKPLYEKGSITEIKFVEVETGLEQAKAMEAISRKSLDDCKLHAPSSGVIAKRSVEEGSNAMPGISAFKLVEINVVNINVSIPESEIGDVKTGQAAIVT